MKNTTSQAINTIIRIIKDIPHTKQWVIFTPTFTVSTWISNDQSLSHQRFEIISGAHTNRFNDALELFNQKMLDGLIVSYEQALNPVKFTQLLDTINEVDILILDQAHRGHLHSLYYSIEMEVMEQQMSIIQPKEVHQLVAEFQSPLKIKDSIIHQLEIPKDVQYFPHNLAVLASYLSSFKRVLWVAQTFNEANTVSAYLSHISVNHALIHKKVEETLKVSLQEKFIQHELHSCVTTIDTQLPLDIQGIDCAVFTFNVSSDQVLSFFAPYVIDNASWNMIDWFKPIGLKVLGHPINQNMFDFIHHVSMIEGGCSMREAERTLNIDSYEFERIIKFLKGRSIIKKIGLKYVIDQAEAIHALYEEFNEPLIMSKNFNIIEQHHEVIPFPERVIFPIVSKKIMPVGFYDFTTIPNYLKHEEGFIFASKPDLSTIKHFLSIHRIECIIDAASVENGVEDSELLKDVGLPILPIQSTMKMIANEARNPYQRVKLAKAVVYQLIFPELSQFNQVALVINSYDEGWFLSILSIAIRNHAPHVQLYPICLNF